MIDNVWEELLVEFRALGGTADNIRIGQGLQGRGVFPVDPALPITIRIPENLLMTAKDAIFQNGQFRVRAGAAIGAREATFLQNYENMLSWGGGGRAEMEGIFGQAQELPAELREILQNKYHCGDWFTEPSDEAIEDRFLESRHIHYQGRIVLMPFIELLNHNPEAPRYNTKDGISHTGVFSGEVLVKYSDMDPHELFAHWGFACEQPQAFSVALNMQHEQRDLHVDRDLNGLSPSRQFWIPGVTKDDGSINLEYLMLGNQKFPRMCKGIFYKLMHENGVANVEETFDIIRHANFIHVAGLLSAVEKIDALMAETVRRVARFQLQALSFCYGVRQC